VQQAVTGYPVVQRDEGGVALRFAFLNQKLPPFNNRKARQALNYAIDRQALITLRRAAQPLTPTCQTITPGTTGYRPYCPYTIKPNDAGTWTAPNLPLAKTLVRESGTRGERVVVWPTPGAKEKQEPSADYFVHVLRQLGYRATLHRPFATFPDYTAAIFRGHAQIGTLGYCCASDGGDQIVSWTCDFTDPGRYCNPSVDALYRRGVAMQVTNPAGARRTWAQVDKMLVNDAAIVPVWSEPYFALVSTRVGNWSTNVGAGILLGQLWVK
jgi:peptide/nickel transport system substrate-binding protein